MFQFRPKPRRYSGSGNRRVRHPSLLCLTKPRPSLETSLGRRTGSLILTFLPVSLYSNYAAVAADTFSSELGILAQSNPRLITSLTLREVPPGTNGGVTAAGLGAGLLGAFSIALTSALILPACSTGPDIQARVVWTVAMSLWGLLGSILDSVLGGLLQASVVDKRSGKIVEGSGGRKVRCRCTDLRTTSAVMHGADFPACSFFLGPHPSGLYFTFRHTRRRRSWHPAGRESASPQDRGRGQCGNFARKSCHRYFSRGRGRTPAR